MPYPFVITTFSIDTFKPQTLALVMESQIMQLINDQLWFAEIRIFQDDSGSRKIDVIAKVEFDGLSTTCTATIRHEK